MTIIRSILIAVALTAAPISSAACQQIPAAEASWTKQAGSVPFDLFRGNRIVAAGAINGNPVEFILDTGAGVTTVDRAFARKIGLPAGQKIAAQGAGGTVDAELITGVTLTIGNLRLSNSPVVAIDLADIARGIGRPADVILGRELFNNAVVGIDWQAKTLTLAKSEGFVAPAGASRIDLGKGSHRVNTIPVSVAGLPETTALFDLGNGSALSLPRSFWANKPELANLPFAQSEAGGVGGLHPVRLVTLGEVRFGGQTFTNVPAVLSEATRHGAVDEVNAGIGLLKPFKVTMDLGNNRLFLERAAVPATFQRDRAGLRTEFDGSALTLAFVSPGSPAATAGLKKGDRLVSIDGQRVDARYYSSASSGWNQRPAGEKVRIGLADGREVTVTLADYF